MKFRLLLTCVLFAFGINQLQAQEQTTIKAVQTQKAADNDTSALFGKTVKLSGVVMTPPAKHYLAPRSYSFWIQAKGESGPQSGLFIRLSRGNTAEATGVKTLVKGQEVELVGVVDYFNGETQLALDSTQKVKVLNLGVATAPAVKLGIGELNDNGKIAKSTGEAYQGSYIMVENAEVISVNSSNNRMAFTVKDKDGNQLDVFDPNIDMRDMKNGFDLLKPKVGVIFQSISGFVSHRKFENADPSYVLNPFDTSDFKINSKTVPPSASNLLRNPVCPKPTEPVKVGVSVIHPAGTKITKVTLKYAIGGSNTTYTSLDMNANGSDYSAEIPAQAKGSFVHYFIEVSDENGNELRYPTFSPYSYTVSENGCNIPDIQYTTKPIYFSRTTRYDSGYRDHVVTDVRGVVVASAKSDNLGYCFVQDYNSKSWSGIRVVGDIIDALNVGDSVLIKSGTVNESFGLTEIINAKLEKIGNNRTVEPIEMDFSAFTQDTQSIGSEAYEGMFVKFSAKSGKNLSVINPIVEPNSSTRSMDWAIGEDPLDPSEFFRVMTGGEPQDQCSKNVGYINQEKWRVNINSGVDVNIVDATFKFKAVQGIITYSFDRVKILPRINSDIIGVVGRGDLLTGNSYQLYPNPTTGSITLQTPIAIQNIEIINVLGQVVANHITQGTENTFSTNGLPEGTFVLRAYDEKGNFVLQSKMIVIR